MAKRKNTVDSSDSDANIKEEEEDKEEKPLMKKVKKEDKVSSANTSSSTKGTVLSTPAGEKYVELGKKKRATVRSFKKIPLLDIREYYTAGEEEKPGKKGISLTKEQWEILKTSASAIDELFAAQIDTNE